MAMQAPLAVPETDFALREPFGSNTKGLVSFRQERLWPPLQRLQISSLRQAYPARQSGRVEEASLFQKEINMNTVKWLIGLMIHVVVMMGCCGFVAVLLIRAFLFQEETALWLMLVAVPLAIWSIHWIDSSGSLLR